MSALGRDINRWLVWFHRWAGVALCLLVAAWFVSGAILHFVPYPALERSEQLTRSDPLDLGRVRIAPQQALARMPADVTELRLVSVAGRPSYIGSAPSGTRARIAADTGELLPPFGVTIARTVAARFAGSAASLVTGPLDYDQWMVHQRFDPYRLMFRVRMADPERTDLYVSAATGEVVQRTTFTERAWNWPGAVLHWLYFTPLRRNWSAWNQTVWWLSLITLLSATVGLWLGVDRLIANRSAGRAGLSPFRGWMRWHHVIGLFTGLIVFGWMLSGWLSMDHGRLFPMGKATPVEVTRLRGLPLTAVAAAASLETVQGVGVAKSISFRALGGQSFLAVENGGSTGSHVLWLAGGQSVESLSDTVLLAAVRTVWRDATPARDRFDDLYRLAEHLPLTARGFMAPGEEGSRIYVDSNSGEILSVMNRGRRAYAWVYYALHTLNFPGLLAHPLGRVSIELLLLAGGLASGVTGIVLAFRRVRRDLAH
jgi:hypothetical protein